MRQNPLLIPALALLFAGLATVHSSSPPPAGAVTFRGVSCFFSPERNELFLQDDANGVRVRVTTRPEFELAVGQLIEVDGETVSLPTGPELTARQIRLLGEGPLPVQLRPGFEEMADGKVDCLYCEFEGVVRSVDGTRNDHLLALEVAGAGGCLTALVRDYHLGECRKLIDAKAQFSGVCFRELESGKRLRRVTLLLSGMGGIAVVRPAPADPWAAESLPVERLAGTNNQFPHRIKVVGAVSFHVPGSRLYLQDHSGGVRVETSQLPPVRAGDIIEVLGFTPSARAESPSLENALYRGLGKRADLVPRKSTMRELQAGSCLNQLVEIEGVASLSSRAGPGSIRLQLDNISLAIALPPDSLEKLPRLPAGTRLRLTGVSVRDDQSGPVLLLRSAADLRKLGQPAGATAIKIILLVFLVAGTLGIWRLRRRRCETRPGG